MRGRAVNKDELSGVGGQPDCAAAEGERNQNTGRLDVTTTLASLRGSFVGVALFSGMSNLLMLTGAFFMLQVYDRVLPGGGVSTLTALFVLAVALFVAQGMFEAIRGRLLARIGGAVDEALSQRVYNAVVRLPLTGNTSGDGLQPVRDLDTIRGFLAGQGPAALFDLPWMPFYLFIIYLFHPVLGVTATIGAVVLVCLTVMTEFLSRNPMREAAAAAGVRNALVQSGFQNAEVMTAMGMRGDLGNRWQSANRDHRQSLLRAGDIAGGFGAMSKSLRLLLQSTVLAVGAYLVIGGEATAGIIIAGSILVARALAPVDQAIANSRNFVAARQSWRRLDMLLRAMPMAQERTSLPPPSRDLTLDNVGIVCPGQTDSVVHNASFALKAGQGLGIVGPSGSGKSSLVRALVGVWSVSRGRICLDNASLTQWTNAALGRHIGYLPQDVELFAGTIAENIARFSEEASSEAVIAAAKAAGVHDLIVDFRDGYDTVLGESGRRLSAGQRQRIALARALYNDPFLVVLDEPNSNLDAEGEAALNSAIRRVRSRGGIVIVVAHRKAALAELDTLLVMSNGSIAAFGEKEQVLARTLRAAVKEMPSSPMPAQALGGSRS